MSNTRNRKFSFPIIAALLIASLALANCGGEGGGGGAGSGASTTSYTGSTSQATITQDNAQTLTDAGSNSGRNSSATAGGSGVDAPRLLRGIRFAAGLATHAPETLSGACGGTSVSDSSYDSATGKITGSTTYSAYCQNGTTENGEQAFTGTYTEANSLLEVTITYTNYATKDSTSDTIMNGTATLKGTLLADGGMNNFTVIMNVDTKDNIENIVTRMENVNITFSSASGYSEFTISSGKTYYPDYGYFDLSTPTPIRTNTGDETPSSGVLVIAGANNSKAKLTYLSNTQYTVEVDETGSGTYTLEGTYDSTTDQLISGGPGTDPGTGTGESCRTYATAGNIVETIDGGAPAASTFTFSFNAASFTGSLSTTDGGNDVVNVIFTYGSVADFVDEAPGMYGGISFTTSVAAGASTTTSVYDGVGRRTSTTTEMDMQDGTMATVFLEIFSSWDTKGRVTASKRDYTTPGMTDEKCAGQDIAYTYDDTNKTMTETVTGGANSSSFGYDWCALSQGAQKTTFDANFETKEVDSTFGGEHIVAVYTTTATAQTCK